MYRNERARFGIDAPLLGNIGWLNADTPRSTRELLEELNSSRGEGYLMRQQDPNQLTQDLEIIMQARGMWGSIGKKLVLDAAGLAIRAHRKQTRKDGVTPYSVHPLRVAIRLALYSDVDAVTLATALLHDTTEDKCLTVEQIKRELCDIGGNTQKDVDKVCNGVQAMDKKMLKKEEEGGGIDTADEYYARIDATQNDPEYPNHLWLVKGEDRYDNSMSDAIRAIDNPSSVQAQEIKHYLAKLTEILPFIHRREPSDSATGVLSRIDRAIDLGSSLAGSAIMP